MAVAEIAQLPVVIGKSRAVSAASIGGPKGAGSPVVARVSITRHGTIG
jgi:hypothetical protein